MIIASISEQSTAPLALHNGSVQKEAEGGPEHHQGRFEQEIKYPLVLSYDHQSWIGHHLGTKKLTLTREREHEA